MLSWHCPLKVGIFSVLDEPLPQMFGPQYVCNQPTLLTAIAGFGQFFLTWALYIMGDMFKAAFETSVYSGFLLSVE